MFARHSHSVSHTHRAARPHHIQAHTSQCRPATWRHTIRGLGYAGMHTEATLKQILPTDQSNCHAQKKPRVMLINL